MTDKEKMQYILDIYNPTTYEEFIGLYIIHYRSDFNDQRFLDLQYKINKRIYKYLMQSSHNKKIAKENAQYVELYLKGELYTNEEYAKQCLPLQIEHAEKVVKLLDE